MMARLVVVHDEVGVVIGMIGWFTIFLLIIIVVGWDVVESSSTKD